MTVGNSLPPLWARNYESSLAVLNAASPSTRAFRTGLAKVRNNLGSFRLGVISDSTSSGYGLTPGSQDGWTYFRKSLKAMGYATGELVYLYSNNAGGGGPAVDPRFTLGNWVPNLGCLYTGTNNLTFTSTDAGTVVEVLHSGAVATTITVDGGTPVVTSVYGYQLHLTRITGLANTTHTVVIAGGANVAVAAVGVQPANGVIILNAGRAGSTTNDWLPTTDFFTPLSGVMGGAPDFVTVQLGGNDLNAFQNISPDLFQTNLGVIPDYMLLNGLPNLKYMYACSHAIPSVSPYHDALYAAAAGRAVTLLDLNAKIGPDFTGLLNSDNIHMNSIGNVLMSQAYVEALKPVAFV